MTRPTDRVFLETDRLVLRRLADDDTDAGLLLELDSDPEVMRYVGPYGFTTVAAYRDLLRARILPYYAAYPDRGVWAMIEKAGGAFAGWILFRPAVDYRFAAEAGWTRLTDVEVGYRLRRAAWGRGLATEGAAALVRLARADPAVGCVVACALVPNRASTRVMEKVGMARVREFALPGFDPPAVVYAACPDGVQPTMPVAHSPEPPCPTPASSSPPNAPCSPGSGPPSG